jgi:N-acetylglucosaminyl-diphospho-decaprenol L-rhamnosyltransferase
MMKPPAAAVVVPTHNGATRISRLLDSLRLQTLAHDVVVVDNASTDGTRELLERDYTEISLIALDKNVGFGRAVNRGVMHTSSSTVVLLNNDVICEPKFLERICAVLDPADGVVMAAGVLLQGGNPAYIDTAGIEFDRTLLGFDYLHGEHVSVLDEPLPDPLGPCAGAAAFDRAAFAAVGGFDEAFFAYLEDIDLAARLLLAGGRCRLAPSARAVHEHSATLGPRSRIKGELIGWGRGYIIGKYRMHRNPRLLGRALLTEAVGAVGKTMVDRNPLGIRVRIQGWRAGRRSPAQSLAGLPQQVNRVSIVDALARRVRRRLRPN